MDIEIFVILFDNMIFDVEGFSNVESVVMAAIELFFVTQQAKNNRLFLWNCG